MFRVGRRSNTACPPPVRAASLPTANRLPLAVFKRVIRYYAKLYYLLLEVER